MAPDRSIPVLNDADIETATDMASLINVERDRLISRVLDLAARRPAAFSQAVSV